MIDIAVTVYFWITAAISTIITTAICIVIYPFLSEKTYARTYEAIIGTLILKFMTIPGFWAFAISSNVSINITTIDGKGPKTRNSHEFKN